MKRTNILLLVILTVSVFIRFYRIQDIAGFDFDQERVAISATKILEGDFTLIGQETSVGGVFVGPWYDYIVAILLFISKGNPSIIYYSQAIIGAITTFLLFKIGEYHYPKAGIVAASLYSISSRFVNIDQNSTPTNAIVFFTVLSLFVANLKNLSHKRKLIILASISGFAAQMHPSGFAIVIVFLLLLRYKGKFKMEYLIPNIFAFLFWFFPLVLFDLRNNFLNLRGLLVTARVTVNYPLIFRCLVVANTTIKSWLQIFITSYYDSNIRNLLFGIVLLIILIVFFNQKYFKYIPSCKLLITVLFSSPFLFSFYKGHVPDYYLFPSMIAFLIIISIFLRIIADGNVLFKLFPIVFIVLLFIINFSSNFKSRNPYSLLAKKGVVQFIKKHGQNDLVNIHISADLGQNYGFEYLLKHWAKINYNLTEKDADFIIYIPKSRASGGMEFADIRVVDMKNH